MNSAWLAISLIAAGLLSWLRLTARDGDLARAEPKTLRILHAAAKLIRGGRRRQLKISVTWPWAQAIATAWTRVTALPQAP
jgi:Transposase DDE domain group 1